VCCGLFINHVDIWDLGLTNTVFSLLLVFWDFFFFWLPCLVFICIALIISFGGNKVNIDKMHYPKIDVN
jgi:hypothetical protein